MHYYLRILNLVSWIPPLIMPKLNNYLKFKHTENRVLQYTKNHLRKICCVKFRIEGKNFCWFENIIQVRPNCNTQFAQCLNLATYRSIVNFMRKIITVSLFNCWNSSTSKISMIVYLIIVYIASRALRLSCPYCRISENKTKIKETKKLHIRNPEIGIISLQRI